MYIRWIERRHKNPASAHVVFHDAYLVECYRNEAGKPRQRVVCYLGNLRRVADTIPLIEGAIFLHRATDALAEVAATEQIDIAGVMQMLQQALPPLSPARMDELFTSLFAWYLQWADHNQVADPEMKLQQLVSTVIGEEREV